jgi:hypothetical protein
LASVKTQTSFWTAVQKSPVHPPKTIILLFAVSYTAVGAIRAVGEPKAPLGITMLQLPFPIPFALDNDRISLVSAVLLVPAKTIRLLVGASYAAAANCRSSLTGSLAAINLQEGLEPASTTPPLEAEPKWLLPILPIVWAPAEASSRATRIALCKNLVLIDFSLNFLVVAEGLPLVQKMKMVNCESTEE